MIETITILLISLPLILLGKTIGPHSTLILGTKIPQKLLESVNGITRLKKIKIAFISSGFVTLIGGSLCICLDRTDTIFWFILIPLTIAITYMLIQLCLIQKNKKHSIIIAIVSTALVVGTPLMIIMPTLGDSENIKIKNDTLFIDGFYSRTIPLSDIAYVNEDATVPPIKMRINGASLGSYNVGLFRSKENKNVLLYLHSNKTNVTHIQTKNDENIYINFDDSIKSIDFYKELKELYLQTSTN